MYAKDRPPVHLEREVICTCRVVHVRYKDPDGHIIDQKRMRLTEASQGRLLALARWIQAHPIPGYAAEIATDKTYIRYPRPTNRAWGSNANERRRHMAALLR